jgi:superfamily I DNA/RNA helicase
VLWNGGVDDEGRSKGLSADQVSDQPPGTILCESIYRFKGLERDVVVLAEIRPDDERLERLMYVGATRARHHLVVIAPPGLADRLR